MNKKWLFSIGLLMSASFPVFAEEPVKIELNLPTIEGSTSYRPYVAVWVENDQGEVVKNLALWSKEPDWLKDMRRWWRKTGRYGGTDIDAVSSATRRPGTYELSWNGLDAKGDQVPTGRYTVHIEAAREHGSRSWVNTEIELGKNPQTHVIKASEELGIIQVTTGVAQ